MKNIAPVVLFVALLPRLADAQQTDHDFPRTYLFAAPGLATPGSSATLGLGGGIEAPSTPAFLGYSMEVSYLAPVHQFGDGRGLLCFVTGFIPIRESGSNSAIIFNRGRSCAISLSFELLMSLRWVIRTLFE
ncbi:MAG: hypothetical protein DMG21_16485 [Acidobacteria bacterium]|nr:MAG: hypothetical protein DMG21_16485 [Acidobacteriota bacterium]